MTALSANKARASRGDQRFQSFPVAASTVLFHGSLVMINSSGYAVPAAAGAGNKGVAGVSTEHVDNSDGAAGAKWVRVASGEFLVTAASITQAHVGSTMYASDDDTVDEAQGANEPVAGVLVQYESATSGWLACGPIQVTAGL